MNKFAVAAFIAFGALLGISAQAAPVSPTQAASGDAALQKVHSPYYGDGYHRHSYGHYGPHYGYHRHGYGHYGPHYGYGYGHYGYHRHLY